MVEKIDDISYAALKTVICKYYSSISNYSFDDQEKLFSGFGKLSTVARNTFLFPFDLDLYNDLKQIDQKLLLTSGLQEKYGISDLLLVQKYQEYNLFGFGKLLSDTDLIDLELLEKFRFGSLNHHSKN